MNAGSPSRSRSCRHSFPKDNRCQFRHPGTFRLVSEELRQTEVDQAELLLAHLEPGTPLLADGCNCTLPLCSRTLASGPKWRWQVNCNVRFPAPERFPDAYRCSALAGKPKDRWTVRSERPIRVDTRRLAEIVESLTPTAIRLDPAGTAEAELAWLLREQWEIETNHDVFKTHLPGSGALMRGGMPALKRRKLDGLMPDFYEARRLIHRLSVKSAR